MGEKTHKLFRSTEHDLKIDVAGLLFSALGTRNLKREYGISVKDGSTVDLELDDESLLLYMGFSGEGENTVRGVGYNKVGKKIFNRGIGHILELEPDEFITYQVCNVARNRIALLTPMKKYKGKRLVINYEEESAPQA